MLKVCMAEDEMGTVLDKTMDGKTKLTRNDDTTEIRSINVHSILDEYIQLIFFVCISCTSSGLFLVVSFEWLIVRFKYAQWIFE